MTTPSLSSPLSALVQAVAAEVEQGPRRSVKLQIPEPGEPLAHTHEVIDLIGSVDSLQVLKPTSPKLLNAIDGLMQSAPVDRRLYLDAEDKEIEHPMWRAAMVVRLFILDYLREAAPAGPLWNEAVFDRLAGTLTASLEGGETIIDWYVPVYGLTGNVAGSNRIGMVEMKVPDAPVLLRMAEPYVAQARRLGPFDITPKYILHHQLAVPFNLEPWPPLTLPATVAVTALRLAAGGYAHIREIVLLPEPGTAQPRPSSAVYFASVSQEAGLTPTVAEQNTVEIAAELAKKLELVWNEFDLPLNRYASTATRKEAHDRLIDSVIALESLLGSDSQVEAGFRLSTRGGWLLGSSPESRREVAKQLRDLYGVRSKVVHGDPDALRKLDPHLAHHATEAVDLVRLILLKVADKPFTRKDWDKHVRDVLFN